MTSHMFIIRFLTCHLWKNYAKVKNVTFRHFVKTLYSTEVNEW